MSTNELPVSSEKGRMGNMDVLRCLAALAVICIHVVEGPVHSYNGVLNADLLQRLKTIHYLMNWSVPVFFVMTGYFCGKHVRYPYSLALKKVKKYICVLFTVGFFFALLECVYATKHLGMREVGDAILNVLNGKLWDHMWFVYDIIGIYLLLPLLFLFFKHSQEQRILVFLLFLLKVFLPWVGKKAHIDMVDVLPLGSYLFYVCFGLLLSMSPVDRISIRTKGFISIAMILFGIIAIFLGNEQHGYTDLSVCLLTMGIFTLFLNLCIPSAKGFSVLAECTWGVYLIHPLFINLAVKLFRINLLSGMVLGKMILFYLSIVFLSFLCVYLIKHIPVLKSLL